VYDFTLEIYKNVLNTLIDQGFSFLTFSESVSAISEIKNIVLRHDVDLIPANSLTFARMQSEKGIKGTYYFRVIPKSFDEKVIREIHMLGHEVGYHYEDLGATAQRHYGIKEEKKLAKLAIESFEANLKKLRDIVPVKTICMHGSPMSRWDSRLLWKYYDYHDFDIIGEPYFDIDFDKVFYITDTGRRWDGEAFSIRDKAPGTSVLRNFRRPPERPEDDSEGQERNQFPSFHTTFDIIHAAQLGQLPDKMMITFHPQRWTDKTLPWIKELAWQNVKNIGKYLLVKLSD
jgi:hypothetical protein